MVTSVGTIGCGKTTLFRLLLRLTGWPHFESDACRDRRQLVARVKRSTSPTVIVDRNNASPKERETLFQLFPPDTRFIVVDFIGVPPERIWSLTLPRVKARGDNHQNIKYHSDTKKVCMIMRGFAKRYRAPQASEDSRIEGTVALRLCDSVDTNLRVLVDGLLRLHAMEPVSDEALRKVLADTSSNPRSPN